MEPTGNSADSSDRKTGKKIVASSATVKPNGKSIASSAIVKTDVSSTVPLLFSSIPESFSPLNSVPEIKCIRGKKAFLLHGISPESINLFLPYCNEDIKMINVYEYREKGTLKDHRNDSDNPRLSWRQKLEICAKGLHYLHTEHVEEALLFTQCNHSLQAIEALDPNHKLDSSSTPNRVTLNNDKYVEGDEEQELMTPYSRCKRKETHGASGETYQATKFLRVLPTRKVTVEMMVIGELPLSFIKSVAWKHFCSKLAIIFDLTKKMNFTSMCFDEFYGQDSLEGKEMYKDKLSEIGLKDKRDVLDIYLKEAVENPDMMLGVEYNALSF
ncbi:hypothetical protein YC2023_108965 [Brassica napus]